MITEAILKNGPKGIMLSFLLNNIYIAIGKAINVAKKMVQTLSGKPITNPERNINLISPPPSYSF